MASWKVPSLSLNRNLSTGSMIYSKSMSPKSNNLALVPFIVKSLMSCTQAKFNSKELVSTQSMSGSSSTISKFFNWDFPNVKSSNTSTFKNFPNQNTRTILNSCNGSKDTSTCITKQILVRTILKLQESIVKLISVL